MARRARLRSALHSVAPLARPSIHSAVLSMSPRITPARVSSRLAPARSSCLRPTANIRSAPVLVIGQPLSRSRSAGVIWSCAQQPPGRNSDAWLRVAALHLRVGILMPKNSAKMKKSFDVWLRKTWAEQRHLAMAMSCSKEKAPALWKRSLAGSAMARNLAVSARWASSSRRSRSFSSAMGSISKNLRRVRVSYVATFSCSCFTRCRR
mmetsp:Transcript_43623/g.137499  ORF Transcript_43623/g.137499 Transcript_43623/m.137499 type:complete len:208 (-) Transcript_43623:9-632(-)